MSANKIRDLIFEKGYNRVGFSNESSYYSMKHHKKKIYNSCQLNYQKKMPGPCNAKKYCQSLIGKNPVKSVKKSKTITQQRNIFENPNIVDIT